MTEWRWNKPALRMTPNAIYGRNRRKRNKDMGECINQNKAGTHEPPVFGTVRCPACTTVYNKSK